MSKAKVLFLGPSTSPLINWLQEQGEQVVQTADRLSAQALAMQKCYFLISHGYRYILRKDVLDMFSGKAINLHISYLPWNRGADPNLWSFLEDTPKGVTIHYLDEGVDTGDIIVQKRIEFDLDRGTLATSYAELQMAIRQLFEENWQNIKTGNCPRQKQVGKGSTHRTRDKETLLHLMTAGWNTPLSVLKNHPEARQLSKQFWDTYNLRN